jgi:WD40 repeat protein
MTAAAETLSRARPVSPYKGLAPFEDTELDALLFFGREREREIVAANLVASRLTILYGTSGVGKSSLLRAAVARDLRSLPEQPLVVVHDAWADDSVQALTAAMARTAGFAEARSLADACEIACALHGELYLILDQLEEHFVYHSEEESFELGRAIGELVGRLELPVHVLLGVREDALARLDAFKGQVPGLLANRLGLDHLDREAGRRAIVGPVERFGALVPEEEGLAVEPALVDAVLDGVRTGELAPGQGGLGVAGGAVAAERIETPYLQLVMQRLWEVERGQGSRVLRHSTLERLGGPRRIVEEHLERALAALTSEQKELAARMFNHLVTPSGTKIAHVAGDLASFAAAGEAELAPVLRVLADKRVLRPLGENGEPGDRYEIYHDVLGSAVLGWRARHETELALEAERGAARRRHRTLAAIAAASLLGLAVMSVLAVYAFAQRSNARDKAAFARAQQAVALQAATDAERDRDAARRATGRAKAATREAQRQKRNAVDARNVAQHEKENAKRQAARADRNAAAAEESALKAVEAKGQAVKSAHEATRQKEIAEGKTLEAKESAVAALTAKKSALTAKRNAQAEAKIARASSLLTIDPDQSLQLALEAAGMKRSPAVERVLRQALVYERARRVLPGGGGEVRSVEYTPDGRLALVASTDGKAKVFSTASGRVLGAVGHGGFLTTAALSADGGTFVTAGRDGMARLWSTTTRKPLGAVDHGDLIRAVAFSPDGSMLATAGNDGFVRVWDVRTQAPLFARHLPVAVEGVAFDAGGRQLLAVARDAYVLNAATGAQIAVLDQPGLIRSAAFSPDGSRVVTGGLDDVATIWDVQSGAPLHVLRGHTSNIESVAYSPLGNLVATSGADATARVWRADTGENVTPLIGHTNHITQVLFRRDGQQIATISDDGTARLWIGDNFALSAVLRGHLDRLQDAAYSPDGGSLLTSSADGSARIWKAQVNPQLRPLGPRTRAVRGAAFDRSGGLIASGGLDGVVRITRVDGTAVRSIDEGAVVNSVQFSPDARFVLVALERDDALLQRVSDGGLVRTFPHGTSVRSAAFDRTGSLVVTAGADGIARVWAAATGRMERELVHGSPLNDAAFSPDGTLIATAGDDDLAKVWRPDGSFVRRLAGHEDIVTSVAFSPDGSRIVTASRDRDARLWSTATGKLIRTLRGHSSIVSDANFSTDGRWIVTAGPVTVGLWETTTGRRLEPGEPLYFLRGPTARVRTAVFDPNSGRILSTGDDGTVRTYLCELCGTQSQLVRLAETRLRRLSETLTPAERLRYLGMR